MSAVAFAVPLSAALLALAAPASAPVRREAWSDVGAPPAKPTMRKAARYEADVAVPKNHTYAVYTFDTFAQDFGRFYPSDQRGRREAIFGARMAAIQAHNARAASWKLGVNHMTDWTDNELAMLRGHRPGLRADTAARTEEGDEEGAGTAERSDDAGEEDRSRGGGSSLIEVSGVGQLRRSCAGHRASCAHAATACCGGLMCSARGVCVNAKAPNAVDHYKNLPTANSILEQGECGSCWAVAATAAVQLQAVILSKGKFRSVLSPQQMLSCTPNLLECGGQGGCRGATAELGLDYIAKEGKHGRGLHTIDQLEYTAKDDKKYCHQGPNGFSSFLQSRGLPPHAPAVRISGWRRLKANDAPDMMKALVAAGPIVASVVGSGLHFYDSGIFGRCDSNVIDHAVVMMGYGSDDDTGLHYWSVRNSWGKQWGERGYFRLKRYATAHGGEREPCGVDRKPSDGVACKDKPGSKGHYPKQQVVCGVCGILSDSSHPVGAHAPEELFSPNKGLEPTGSSNEVLEREPEDE